MAPWEKQTRWSASAEAQIDPMRSDSTAAAKPAALLPVASGILAAQQPVEAPGASAAGLRLAPTVVAWEAQEKSPAAEKLAEAAAH